MFLLRVSFDYTILRSPGKFAMLQSVHVVPYHGRVDYATCNISSFLTTADEATLKRLAISELGVPFPVVRGLSEELLREEVLDAGVGPVRSVVNVVQPSMNSVETFFGDVGKCSRKALKIGEQVVNIGNFLLRNVEGSVNVTEPAHFATGLPRGISWERLAFFKHVESEMYGFDAEGFFSQLVCQYEFSFVWEYNGQIDAKGRYINNARTLVKRAHVELHWELSARTEIGKPSGAGTAENPVAVLPVVVEAVCKGPLHALKYRLEGSIFGDGSFVVSSIGNDTCYGQRMLEFYGQVLASQSFREQVRGNASEGELKISDLEEYYMIMVLLPSDVSATELIPPFPLNSTTLERPDPGVDPVAAYWFFPPPLDFIANTGGWSWKSVKNTLDDYMSVIIK